LIVAQWIFSAATAQHEDDWATTQGFISVQSMNNTHLREPNIVTQKASGVVSFGGREH